MVGFKMRIFGAIWRYFSSICNLLCWNILEMTGWKDFPTRLWKFFPTPNFSIFSPHFPIISYYITKSSNCQYRNIAQIFKRFLCNIFGNCFHNCGLPLLENFFSYGKNWKISDRWWKLDS